MRIAMAQISGTDDVAINRELISKEVANAAAGGADLVVFPEDAMRRTAPGKTQASTAESIDGPFVTYLQELARTHKTAIVAGAAEKSDGGADRPYNTVVAIGAAGELIGAYRKIHLFDAFGAMESDDITAGDGSMLVFPFGEHVIGVATCYDLRFPEMARALVDQGATVILYPSAWRNGPLKEEHWEVLL